jgi:hypothetical protein
MTDYALSNQLRLMNQKFIKHIGEDYESPHTRFMSASKKYDDNLEGGFFQAIAIAARAAAAAAKAAARAAAQAAKAGAKSAANAAKAGAKGAKDAAKQGVKSLKNMPKNIKNASAYDKARGVISAVEMAHDIQSMIRKGEPMIPELWNSLDPNQKVVVDIKRWSEALPNNWRSEFERAGGNQAAAFYVLRLMNQGPEDNVAKEMDKVFDDRLDDLLEPPLNDFEDCDNEYGCGPPVANCYGNGGPGIGWYWVSAGAKAYIAKENQDGCGPSSAANPTNCGGGPGRFEERKACLQRKANEIEAKRNEAKKVFDISGNIPTDLTEENIMKYNAAANRNFFKNKPSAQEQAINNDFFSANGITPPTEPFWNNKASYSPGQRVIYQPNNKYYKAKVGSSNEPPIKNNQPNTSVWTEDGSYDNTQLEIVYRAQSLASWMLQNKEFSLEAASSSEPYATWIKDDPTLFTRALAQASAPENFLDATPYNNTKDLITSIGGGSTLGQQTQAQIRQQTRYTVLVEENSDVIDDAIDEMSERDYTNKINKAEAYSATKEYQNGDLAKKDGKVYLYINDNKSIGNAPPNKIYWEEQNTYTIEDLDEIQKISNAVLWNQYNKYDVGEYVTYMGDTYVKIKDSAAGVLPTVVEFWTKVDVLDPLAYDTNKATYPNWVRTTTYKIGDKVSWNSKYYSSTRDNNQGQHPDTAKEYWQQIFMFTLTDEMKQDIAINQRISTYTQAVDSAVEFELGQQYNVGDIVVGPDGNYYRLIEQKKDKAGNLVDTPRPPLARYWELISAGEKDYNDTTVYKVNDIVKYKGKEYLLLKTTEAGTKPDTTTLGIWKSVDAIFDDIPPDVKASFIQNQKDADIAVAEDFDFEADGYTEGDIVTTYNDKGIPTIWRCIKSYDLPKTATLQNRIDSGPPNPQYWEDTAAETEETVNAKIRDTAIDWSVGSNDTNKKLIKNGDVIYDKASDTYWKFSIDEDYAAYYQQFQSRNKDPYIIKDYKYNTKYLEPPDEVKEDTYLQYRPGDLPVEFLQTNYIAPYRWDLMADVITTTQAAADNFDEKHKWLPSKTYKKDDIVIYNGYYFRALKDVPVGIIPYSKDGVLNEVYYDWIDKESDIIALKEDYEIEQADAEQKKQEFALQQWIRGDEYNDGDLVYNNGGWYIFQSYNGKPDNATYEPGNEKEFKDYPNRNNGGWFEANPDGTLKPEKFDPLQGYKQYVKGGTIVHYNDKSYVMNNRNKAIFNMGDGTFPEPPGDTTQVNYAAGEISEVPSESDPTYWVEVFDDGSPVNKVDDTGKVIGKNDAPTKKDIVASQQAEVDPNSSEAQATHCPTMDDDEKDNDDDTGDTHHDDVEAAKALEQAIIEWKAKGEQGPKPGTEISGAGFDDLEPVDYSYLTKTKRKYVRKNKNIKK